jgi:hypothetical protein
MKSSKKSSQTLEILSHRIHFFRGQQVMLDFDLAELYGVSTKRLNEQLKRNDNRFPPDFAFQLKEQEFASLRSQFATSKEGRGGRRYLPWAFTEHGVAMLSGILNSPEAVQVNILVIREFIRLRVVLNSNAEFEKRMDELESNCETRFEMAFEAIRELMSLRGVSRKRIKGLSEK